MTLRHPTPGKAAVRLWNAVPNVLVGFPFLVFSSTSDPDESGRPFRVHNETFCCGNIGL